MIKHSDSHLDHALTEAQIQYLFNRLNDRDGFFIETIELPLELGTVPCDLYGPIMGDLPVLESDCHYGCRGSRQYESRLVDRPARPSRQVTVIAGPHDGHACVLFTAFGGPLAPKETRDPTNNNAVASSEFWQKHALATPKCDGSGASST